MDDEWDFLARFDVDTLIRASNRVIDELLAAILEQDDDPELAQYWTDLGGSE